MTHWRRPPCRPTRCGSRRVAETPGILWEMSCNQSLAVQVHIVVEGISQIMSMCRYEWKEPCVTHTYYKEDLVLCTCRCCDCCYNADESVSLL